MEGVTILSENTSPLIPLPAAIALGVLSGCMFAIEIFTIIRAYKDQDKTWIVLGIIPLLISIIVGGVALKFSVARETTYKVLVSDEAKLSEFMDKYEIVNRDGMIYEVKEK